MPSDSPAAGLVTLGVLRRRLEFPNANDMRFHSEQFNTLGDSASSSRILVHSKDPGLWKFDGVHSTGVIWAERVDCRNSKGRSSKSIRRTITLAEYERDWMIQGDPPVVGEGLHYQPHYLNLIENAGGIFKPNFERSDLTTGVCFAGRASGLSESRRVLEEVCFRSADRNANLAELLTVGDWSENVVSRVSTLNTRTDSIDPDYSKPKIIVADGDKAYLRVRGADRFEGSDIICVYHRGIDRDRLDQLHEKARVDQWYLRDTECMEILPSPPNGIAFTVLKRKAPQWA